MAKNNGNLFLNRFTGMAGDQMVLRKGKDGRTIMCARPTYDENRTYSPARLIQQGAFREVVVYAKEKQGAAVYIARADGADMSPYNLAMADGFHRPQIRVKAYDDVKVVEVRIRLGSDDGVVLEEGLATETGALRMGVRPHRRLDRQADRDHHGQRPARPRRGIFPGADDLRPVRRKRALQSIVQDRNPSNTLEGLVSIVL